MTIFQDCGVLAIPTVPGPPPKLQCDPIPLEAFRAKAFSLLSIAGVSGFCQVLSFSLSLYIYIYVCVCVCVCVVRHDVLTFSLLVLKPLKNHISLFLHIYR